MSAPRLSEVLENVLGGLGLACARLSADDDRLVTFQHAHVAVCLVGYSVQSQHCQLMYVCMYVFCKLLGVIFQVNLKMDAYVEYILSQYAQRVYLPKLLRRMPYVQLSAVI